ncbi:hypothetical protein [Dichotomicrobium thermohalophilum]|uniref:Uncharacterized protein n=1 Tax=Dichotomicrobium thermohalophilum TaxID=933063 RepID=A0A397Q645_9HYPH|nr:hypothetical protein [Dichotomicrobium thermohalophilum]RIA56518.1 hypothetical protein BXY53_1624 [Dichotomicrobium thermohalophilum]
MADSSMAGQTVALAAILAAGTFLLYFLKHALDALRTWHDAQRRAERLVCALYAEIEANVHDMQAFLDDSLGWERAIRENNTNTSSHFGRIGHDLVYSTHLSELASLPRAVIYKVVAFYSHRERLAAMLDRLEAINHAGADQEQQIASLKQAREIAQEAVTFGKEVLYGLEVHAPMELVNAALRKPATGLRAKAA